MTPFAAAFASIRQNSSYQPPTVSPAAVVSAELRKMAGADGPGGTSAPALGSGTAPAAVQAPAGRAQAVATVRRASTTATGRGRAALPPGTYVKVNPRQRGNPVLKHVQLVTYQFVDGLEPDYEMTQSACAFFLSLRYHLLHPEYLVSRIRGIGRDYSLRVVLVLVDVEDNVKPIQAITQMATTNGCTVILAWSYVEAGRYLETYKQYENKPADSIKERIEDDYLAQLTDALTMIRSVNKTDAVTLINAFGSLAGIMKASVEELALCPGLGAKKVQRIYEAFRQPFKASAKRLRTGRPIQSFFPKGDDKPDTAPAPAQGKGKGKGKGEGNAVQTSAPEPAAPDVVHVPSSPPPPSREEEDEEDDEEEASSDESEASSQLSDYSRQQRAKRRAECKT